MSDTPEDFISWDVPEGWSDPVADERLPYVTEYNGEADPTPSASRLSVIESGTVKFAAKPRGYFGGGAHHSSFDCAIPGINLDSWTTPLSRGWGQSCNVQLARVNLSEASISVNAGIAELVGLIMRANEAQGYVYRKGDTGCYNCRSLRQGGDWSWHAWALAIDCNWGTNPMRYPVQTDRPSWEIQRWNRYGFGWGGDYDPSNPPDAMHVEFHGTPQQAVAALALARKELGGNLPQQPNPPAPQPQPAPSGNTAQVKKDQFDLTDTGFPVKQDGIWGPASVAACKGFQYAAHIAVDGICGDNTRANLHKVPSWHSSGPFVADDPGGHSALEWQRKLKEHGWHIETDGVWGAHSKSILRQFQQDKGHLTVDGLRGPCSWTALFCTVN